MNHYIVKGQATIQCGVEVEANNEKEAKIIALEKMKNMHIDVLDINAEIENVEEIDN